MKRIFLVDIENVGKSFLKGIEKLTISDEIIVCNNRTVRDDFSRAIREGLSRTKAIVKKFHIENANKNAMDFHIMMQLGYMIAENGNSAEYYIVSNDRGFDVANHFAGNNHINAKIRRIATLEANFAEEERINNMTTILTELLPEYSKKVVKIVQQGIDASKTTEELHNFLQNHLRRDFRCIYPKVKCFVECRG